MVEQPGTDRLDAAGPFQLEQRLAQLERGRARALAERELHASPGRFQRGRRRRSSDGGAGGGEQLVAQPVDELVW